MKISVKKKNEKKKIMKGSDYVITFVLLKLSKGHFPRACKQVFYIKTNGPFPSCCLSRFVLVLNYCKANKFDLHNNSQLISI